MFAPWKLLYASVAGTAHGRSGEPCQDAAVGRVVAGVGPTLVAACADGAGSTTHGGVGARLACRAFLTSVAESLESGLAISEIEDGLILGWLERARRRLSFEACVSGFEGRDFACTLLVALIGPENALFAQIGDGAIVYRDGDVLAPAFWPATGEYHNTTFFLTDEAWRESVAVRRVVGRVDEVALLTDGLQRLALVDATRSVHAPFFEPMFAALARIEDVADLETPLRLFLDSDAVNARTDDDKTLVLAGRRTRPTS